MNKKTREAIDRFLKLGNRRMGGVFSPATVSNYEMFLKDFFDFTGKDFTKVTDKDCESFFSHLKEMEITLNGKKTGKKLNEKSVFAKMSAVKAFYRFAIEHDLYKGKNPIYISIMGLKSSPSFVQSQIMSREEVRKLMESVVSPRDRLILELLYNTGMRHGELRKLNLSDIDLERNTIKIIGKGNKERLITIGEDVHNALKLWLIMREDKNTDALITGKFGGRLDGYYINELIRKACVDNGVIRKTVLCDECKKSAKETKQVKYCKKCKWDRKLTAHSFRHTFISHCIEDDVKLAELSGFVGHGSIDMTLSYTNFTKLGNTVNKRFRGIHKGV